MNCFLSCRLCKTLPCFTISGVKELPHHLLKGKPGAATRGSLCQARANRAPSICTGLPGIHFYPVVLHQHWELCFSHFLLTFKLGRLQKHLLGQVSEIGWILESEYQGRVPSKTGLPTSSFFLDFGVWLVGCFFCFPENTIPAVGHA